MLARKLFIGLAALVILAVATPAMAGDEFKGWYGALDLALTQPAGLDQHYANHVDYTECDFDCTQTERLMLDNDDEFTWGAAFGYSFGKMGMLQVSYWGFSNGDEFEGNLGGGVYPVIFGYSPDIGGFYLYNSGSNGGVDFVAGGDVKAQTWDIDYIRPMAAGEKFSVNWLAGLRVAEYRENQSFRGHEAGYYFFGYYNERKEINNHGWGLKVGATANMDFTSNFGIEAGLAVSFLQTESSGQSKKREDGGETDRNEGTDDSQRGEIRDYSLAGVWHQGPVDIIWGFKSSNWDGIVSDPVPAVEGGHYAQGQSGTSGRDNVSFNSWHVGARWKIGG